MVFSLTFGTCCLKTSGVSLRGLRRRLPPRPGPQDRTGWRSRSRRTATAATRGSRREQFGMTDEKDERSSHEDGESGTGRRGGVRSERSGGPACRLPQSASSRCRSSRTRSTRRSSPSSPIPSRAPILLIYSVQTCIMRASTWPADAHRLLGASPCCGELAMFPFLPSPIASHPFQTFSS